MVTASEYEGVGEGVHPGLLQGPRVVRRERGAGQGVDRPRGQGGIGSGHHGAEQSHPVPDALVDHRPLRPRLLVPSGGEGRIGGQGGPGHGVTQPTHRLGRGRPQALIRDSPRRLPAQAPGRLADRAGSGPVQLPGVQGVGDAR
jgi:hypothetical protein